MMKIITVITQPTPSKSINVGSEKDLYLRNIIEDEYNAPNTPARVCVTFVRRDNDSLIVRRNGPANTSKAIVNRCEMIVV
jgi:hypothetical protein